MDRERLNIGLQSRPQANLRRSNRKSAANLRPPDSDVDAAAKIITALVIAARPTAAAVLRTIAEELAAQEKVVLFEYLRTPAIKQVAGQLGKQEQTIRNQLSAIREKLAADSLCDLVRKVILALVLCSN